jgi:N-acetyl sugar amidotransferase
MERTGPPHPQLRYCLRCCLPETVEGITFDERGVCSACSNSEGKMHIEWEERERMLRALLDRHREAAKDRAYDCLLPVSGGKDSTFQAHVLVKVYGMRPLAVTFSHNWYTETGKRNLERLLETFDLDHIQFTPKRSLVNRLARQSIYKIGDSCWHCHAGVGAFPLRVAIKFGIGLIVWGESVAELGCKGSYEEAMKRDLYDDAYVLKVSARQTIEQMAGDDIPLRELEPFRMPTRDQFLASGVKGIHLGDYLFWDDEKQVDFIKKEYGWEEDEVEGTYKRYKSVECIMPGLHDYTKYLKRGFGRATDHAAKDVRAGLMTREEAFALIRQIDPVRPRVLEYFTRITGLTVEEVEQAVKAQRTGAARKLDN